MLNSNKQIAFGALLSYFIFGIELLSGFILSPLIVKFLGTSQYGIFTLANSVVNMFIMDFGLSSTTTKFLSKYYIENDKDKAEVFLGQVLLLYLILDIVFFIILTFIYFNIDIIYLKLNALELHQFKYVFILVMISSLISFPCVILNGTLLSYERIVTLKVSDIVYKIARVIFLYFAIVKNVNFYTFIFINIYSSFIAIIIKLLYIIFKLKIFPKFTFFRKNVIKQILLFSFWITVATISERLVINITPTILGRYAGSFEIAVFGIACSIEGYVYVVTNVFNSMFVPKISRIYHNNGNIDNLFFQIGELQFIIEMYIVLVFFIVGKEFIILWMGENYASAYYIILLMIIPGMFYNSLQIGHSAIMVVDKPHIIGICDLFTGLINVSLSFFLSKKFGLIGAGISIFIAYSFRAIFSHIAYHKNLNVNIFNLIKKCYIKFIPLFFIFILIKLLNTFIVSLNDWVHLIIYSVLLSIIFIISVYIIIRKTNEYIYFKKIIFKN